MQNIFFFFFLTIIRVSVLPVKATEIKVLKSSSFWKAAANNTDFRKFSLYDVTKYTQHSSGCLIQGPSILVVLTLVFFKSTLPFLKA